VIFHAVLVVLLINVPFLHNWTYNPDTLEVAVAFIVELGYTDVLFVVVPFVNNVAVVDACAIVK
jgi:hypothetical protein